MNFTTRAYGKWILAGEHAVLRGSPALVFPLKSKALDLTYEEGPEVLRLETAGSHGKELEPLFWAVLHKACDHLQKSRSLILGRVRLDCEIPLGAGLGASAAFCVVIVRWLSHLGWVREDEMYEFARTLENLFHGESSGVDIAVALSGQGLHFERSGVRQPLKTAWTPTLYVSYTGQRGVTSEAVARVKQLAIESPSRGQELDQVMTQAVALCEESLSTNGVEAFERLADGILNAGKCFDQWGLTQGAVRSHMNFLREQGAVAVKPTGSGGGGYVLSLWRTPPPASLRDLLFACDVN